MNMDLSYRNNFVILTLFTFICQLHNELRLWIKGKYNYIASSVENVGVWFLIENTDVIDLCLI